jgi:hypothetical protein
MEIINVIKFLFIYNKFVTQCLAEDDIYNCHMNFFSCFVKYFVPQKSCTVFLGPVNISTIDELSDSLVFATAIDEPIKNSTIFYNRYISIAILSTLITELRGRWHQPQCVIVVYLCPVDQHFSSNFTS